MPLTEFILRFSRNDEKSSLQNQINDFISKGSASISFSNYKYNTDNGNSKYIDIYLEKWNANNCFIFTDISDYISHRENAIMKSFKNSLICAISYEIRTPLHQISCIAPLLEQCLDISINQPALCILTCVKQLSIKFDNLSDFAQIEFCLFKLHKTENRV